MERAQADLRLARKIRLTLNYYFFFNQLISLKALHMYFGHLLSVLLSPVTLPLRSTLSPSRLVFPLLPPYHGPNSFNKRVWKELVKAVSPTEPCSRKTSWLVWLHSPQCGLQSSLSHCIPVTCTSCPIATSANAGHHARLNSS